MNNSGTAKKYTNLLVDSKLKLAKPSVFLHN